MPDIVDSKTRSRMMAGIKSKNTKPELLIRKLLHRAGFRYRLHVASLPAKPDMVLKKYQAVILVHGCFWHGHDCHLFKLPKTRSEFWKNKIEGNVNRDRKQLKELKGLGWRVGIIWECAVRGNNKNLDNLAQGIGDWLKSSTTLREWRA